MDFESDEIESVDDEQFSQIVSQMQALAAADPIPPYQKVNVLRHIRPLRKLLPDAQALRTDRISVEATSPDVVPERLIFENREGQILLAFTPNRDQTAYGPLMGHIGKCTRLADPEIEELLEICHDLLQVNAMGAWCLRPAESEGRLVSATHIGERALQRDSFLARMIDNLSELLPSIKTINVKHQVRGRQRRQWCQFLNHQGLEVAAIDSKAFGVHLRSIVVRPNINLLELNILRCCIWSQQLECSLEELAEVIHELMALIASVQASTIVLSSGGSNKVFPPNNRQ